jgi:hypothetical protein
MATKAKKGGSSSGGGGGGGSSSGGGKGGGLKANAKSASAKLGGSNKATNKQKQKDRRNAMVEDKVGEGAKKKGRGFQPRKKAEKAEKASAMELDTQ